MAALVRMLICGFEGELKREASCSSSVPAPHFRRTDINSVYELGQRLGQVCNRADYNSS